MRNRLIAALLLLLAAVSVPGEARSHGEHGPAERAGVPVLREGARGDAVLSLQRLLSEAGFSPGAHDGVYGPATGRAVRNAQAEMDLKADGIVGPATAKALGLSEPSDSPEDRPAFRQLVVFTADQAAVGPIRDDKPPQEPFALTFNVGPEPQQPSAILDLLAEHQARATFFVHGETALLHPDLMARIVAAGHEVGNYGSSYRDLTRLSPAMLQADLLRSSAAIRSATGTEPRFFRAPTGAFNHSVRQTAADLGMEMVMWTNIAARDLPALHPSELAARLEEAIYPGAVIMLHTGRPGAAAALPQVLEAARRDGLVSVTLSELRNGVLP